MVQLAIILYNNFGCWPNSAARADFTDGADIPQRWVWLAATSQRSPLHRGLNLHVLPWHSERHDLGLDIDDTVIAEVSMSRTLLSWWLQVFIWTFRFCQDISRLQYNSTLRWICLLFVVTIFYITVNCGLYKRRRHIADVGGSLYLPKRFHSTPKTCFALSLLWDSHYSGLAPEKHSWKSQRISEMNWEITKETKCKAHLWYNVLLVRCILALVHNHYILTLTHILRAKIGYNARNIYLSE